MTNATNGSNGHGCNGAAESSSFESRVLAVLFGVAYGDALGATVEKLSAEDIREQYGRVESLDVPWWRKTQSVDLRKDRIRGGGIITDDTLMTLCLINVYVQQRRHLDAWDVAKDMVREIAWTPRWIPEMQKETMLQERLFYAEKWIFQRHQLSSCDPRQGGIGNMVNCGAAMYIAPIGVVNACDPKGAYDEAIAFASAHQESYGLEAAGVLAAAVAAAFVPNTTIEQVVDEAIAVAKDGTRAAIVAIAKAAKGLVGQPYAVVTEKFHEVIAEFSCSGDNLNYTAERVGLYTPAYRPSRFQSIEELPIALGFALVNRGDFYKSVADGINSGRDTDSIGGMVGAVCGPLNPSSALDQKLVHKINAANKLDLAKTAAEFASSALAIQIADRKRLEGVFRARVTL